MLQEDKQILWRASATLLGMALPSILLGKSLVFSFLLLGMVVGLMATKDESLRATIRLLLNSRVTLMITVLLGSLLAGVATGINPAFALDKWGQVVLTMVCAALLFVTLREMPGRHVELLLKVLVVATTVVAGLAMLDALLGDARLSAALHGADKALTPYRLNFVSSALAVLLPFSWARLILKAREGEPFAVRIALPAAAFGVLALVVCGGRAGWVGLGAGMAVFLAMAGYYHGVVVHKRHWLGGLLLLVGGLALYGLAFGWGFMIDRASIIGEMGQGRGMLSGRGEVWAQAWQHIGNSPLFGIGVMNYRNLPGAIDMHPHNWLLQFLLEGGVVSTVIFLVLVGMMVRGFFYFAKGNLYGVATLASLAAFLVAGLANTSIFNLWWLTFLVFICVLGWRAGWSGDELKKGRRKRMVAKPDLTPGR